MRYKALFLIAVLLLVGGSLISAFYFYRRYQQVKSNPEIIAKEEVASVTGAISRFMDLPTDEEPTLATVADQEVLKDQDFFKNARNGDKVLIYTRARKAILYRPSTNRIIEFAPLTFGVQEPVTVAIYNGTQIAGLTAKYEKELVSISGIQVTSKTNAAKGNYTKTLVIDLSGKNQAIASQIAEILGGEVVASLPDGEARPQSDILIIAGE